VKSIYKYQLESLIICIIAAAKTTLMFTNQSVNTYWIELTWNSKQHTYESKSMHPGFWR